MRLPSAPAQQLVVQTLLRLRRAGAEVIAIAGNHDHAPTFEAYRPLMGVAGITLVGMARPPDKGGVVRFRARSGGEDVQLAVLPFLTPRYAVRAAEIMTQTPSENVRAYDEMIRQLVDALTGGFSGDTVNLVMSHLTCIGGVVRRRRTAAQSIFEYSVPASIFPVSAHYVALGHLHRRQALPAHCPVHYSGSPIAVDFGEQDNTSVVCLVEASPSTPARVTDIPVDLGPAAAHGPRDRGRTGGAGRLVRRGLPAGLGARAGPRRAARDTVAVLPNALEVRIDPEFAAPARPDRADAADAIRTPGQLFADYCAAVRWRTPGSRHCSPSCTTRSPAPKRRAEPREGAPPCVRSCWT